MNIFLMFLTDTKYWEQTENMQLQQDWVHNLISTQPEVGSECLLYKIRAYKLFLTKQNV